MKRIVSMLAMLVAFSAFPATAEYIPTEKFFLKMKDAIALSSVQKFGFEAARAVRAGESGKEGLVAYFFLDNRGGVFWQLEEWKKFEGGFSVTYTKMSASSAVRWSMKIGVPVTDIGATEKQLDLTSPEAKGASELAVKLLLDSGRPINVEGVNI